MTSALVRGKHVIRRVIDRDRVDQIDDGGIYIEDGVIVEIGRYDELARRHDADAHYGSDDHVIIPGLVNAHHHVGLTPIQHGVVDQPLELWFVTRMAGRIVDPYLESLYATFEMLESGVTTVGHIYGFIPADIAAAEARIDRVLAAYEDIGIRAAFSPSMRNQNYLGYIANDDFVRRLPDELGRDLASHFALTVAPLDEQIGLFERLHARYRDHERIRIQLAPANLHWCTDDALTHMQELAERLDVPMHMHLVETAYQKEYARRRSNGTALQHLGRLGMLGPRLTLGHAVWLNDSDIDLAAETGTKVCHLCSSNLRLRSGTAPVAEFLRRGVEVAMGIDEAGINDDRDMLQEMRLVLKQHRRPGMDDSPPTSAEVLRMATEAGAHTTPFGASIGTLEPGKAADIAMIRWSQMAYPYLDPALSVVDAILHRAKARGVDTVLVAGEPVLIDGRIARLSKDEVLAELARSLSAAPGADELHRRHLSEALLEPARALYENYFDARTHDPFYRVNSRN